MTTGERDRRGVQPLGDGDGDGGTAGQHLARLGADAKDDASGCGAERVEVVATNLAIAGPKPLRWYISRGAECRG